MSWVRRLLVTAAALALLLATASCGTETEGESQAQTVTIVGQNSTEADILTQLYKRLLDRDGYRTRVEDLGARDLYLGPLEKGRVQLAADYLATLTDDLNRRANGETATPVASPDVAATLAQLTTLGEKYGITPLRPARAEAGKGYAVTKAFAQQHRLTTLSDLGRLGRPVALAAETTCADRQDCGPGLERVYGIELSRIQPLGQASGDTTRALLDGQVQLAQVGTTDGTLDRLGIVILDDDKNWQNAENVVPVVNSQWLEDNPKAKAELDKLSTVLTTADLASLNAQVDGQQLEASQVAEDYLKAKGLI